MSTDLVLPRMKHHFYHYTIFTPWRPDLVVGVRNEISHEVHLLCVPLRLSDMRILSSSSSCHRPLQNHIHTRRSAWQIQWQFAQQLDQKKNTSDFYTTALFTVYSESLNSFKLIQVAVPSSGSLKK